MRFIVLCFALLIYYFKPNWIKSLQLDQQFHRIVGTLSKHGGWVQRPIGFIICFVLPVLILVGWLLPEIEYKFLGLLYFIASGFLLINCFGREHIIQKYHAYLETWKSGSPDEALDNLFNTPESRAVNQINDDQEQHWFVRKYFIRLGFEQLFCVLFWFLLSGLTVPLIYRVLKLGQQENQMIPTVEQTDGKEVLAEQSVEKNHWMQSSMVSMIINIIEAIPAMLLILVLGCIRFGFSEILKSFSEGVGTLWSNPIHWLQESAIRIMYHDEVKEAQAINWDDKEARQHFYQQAMNELKLFEYYFLRLFAAFLIVGALWVMFV